MKKLKKQFSNRQALLEHVKEISQFDADDFEASPIVGHISQAQALLNNIKPVNYAKTRNFLQGDVTYLSPYISRGLVTTKQAFIKACQSLTNYSQGEKFFQELAWREYWQQVAKHRPQWLWQDAEPYKTGWQAADYANELPDDILHAQTDCACINAFIRMLLNSGYVHNHARMYLASYIVHWRRVKWQAGAKWFLYHLLDANIASNNLSWQWVASTFSHKPYIFNLENVQKYAGSEIDTSAENNRALNASYEQLSQRLFKEH